jgi:hypothetical protein
MTGFSRRGKVWLRIRAWLQPLRENLAKAVTVMEEWG